MKKRSNAGLPYNSLMNSLFSKPSLVLLLIGVSACTQVPPKPSGMTTYSPFTPQQITEFNNQSPSPAEGPFGPVTPNARDLDLARQQRALNAKYYNQPEGEEEAESLETQSFDPYQSTKPILTF